MPRELLVEGRGPAPSLDHAISHFTDVARFLGTLLAFTANTPVDIPEVSIAYDATEGETRREFLEVFVADEQGAPREGRLVQKNEFAALFFALMASTEGSRIQRALRQYELALRHWKFGTEWLCLTHLYIAVENLVKSVVRQRCEQAGLAEIDLAQSLGIDVADESRWPSQLEGRCRRDFIFDGDNETYRTARYASNGVEHGFLDMGSVIQSGLEVALKTFGYVRSSILDLLSIPRPDFEDLYGRVPRDVHSTRKMIRGMFIGDGSDPAPPGELYPRLYWQSRVRTLRRDQDRFSFTFQEDLTVQCSPSYVFEGRAIEAIRRMEPGEPAAEEVTADVQVSTRTGQLADTGFLLMKRCADFASKIGQQGSTVGMPPFTYNIFGLFAQQIALFEAIEVLLKDRRPVEALCLCGSLMVGACSLETVAKEANKSGVAVRRNMDASERSIGIFGADERFASAAKDRMSAFTASARERGVVVPDVAPSIEGTEFYRSHKKDILFALEIARGDEAAALMHSSKDPQGGPAFRTQIDDDATISGVAADSCAALVAAAVAAAEVFGWVHDTALASQLASEAAMLGSGPDQDRSSSGEHETTA